MKKLWSLIKAAMSSDMSIFKIKTKNQKRTSKISFALILALMICFAMYYYADTFMKPLSANHLEFVVLTVFILITSVMTLTEGIYKSSSLIFNCKDDNLLLSLPLKKSTVLFIRILKFYLFELIYNSLFLAPAMLAYVKYVNVSLSFYVVSVISLLLFPIIPIIISCLLGGVISSTSSRFKFKNISEIIMTTIFLLLIFFVSLNFDGIIKDLAANANSINEIITKLYYPAGAYINLITNFNIFELLMFIFIHIALFVVAIFILSRVYFKINSKVKEVKLISTSKDYKIKANNKVVSLIKKELNRFINTPVFVTNAGFGLVLFTFACILACIKFDSVANMLIENNMMSSIEEVKSYIPLITFGLICFTSLMTSITSSMISLEGKSFIILKSLPINPATIILSKVLTALTIMLPFILIGDIILFIRFNYNIVEIIMLLLSSIIIPLVAETIGILVNLKYPKMDAENDTEVVKQSISTTISVFIGMILVGITFALLVKCISMGINNDLLIFIGLLFYSLLFILLMIYMNKKSVKEFNNITI